MDRVTVRKKDGIFDKILLIHLIAAALLLFAAIFVDVPVILGIIILVASAVSAGYDVVLRAYFCVRNKDYFAASVIVSAVSVLAFFIGRGIDSAATLILYQIGLIFIEYARQRTVESALELVRQSDENIVAGISESVSRDDRLRTLSANQLEHSAGFVLKFAMIFAVLFAILAPVLTGMSFSAALHRSLIILLVSNTLSVASSMPATAAVGMCYAAGEGIISGNAKSLESLSEVSVGVFDKAGIFSESAPRVTSVHSERLDGRTFITFAAHAVYYSEQPFARAIQVLYTNDYRTEVISNFNEIPGLGVELEIKGNRVSLARREFFAGRGVDVPEIQEKGLSVYCLAVNGKYVGYLTISSAANSNSDNLVFDCKAVGIEHCILLTEESRGESSAFAQEMQFEGFYPQCDTSAKLMYVNSIKEACGDKVMFVYANGIQTHSAADIDIRVDNKSKYADIIVLPDYVANIPFAVQVATRMKGVSERNALIAFIVKAVLIFLAVTGWSNLWFTMFLDMAAALAAILNSIRVTKESTVDIFKYKTGR